VAAAAAPRGAPVPDAASGALLSSGEPSTPQRSTPPPRPERRRKEKEVAALFLQPVTARQE
jgi:hypothetical protein